MKKAKRILALLGASVLILMYLCTLVFALMDHPAAADLLRASIGCTILIPVLYGFLLVYRLLSHDQDNEEER